MIAPSRMDLLRKVSSSRTMLTAAVLEVRNYAFIKYCDWTHSHLFKGVGDPGNINAVKRSAECFGIQHVHVIGDGIGHDWVKNASGRKSFSRAVDKGASKWCGCCFQQTDFN